MEISQMEAIVERLTMEREAYDKMLPELREKHDNKFVVLYIEERSLPLVMTPFQ